VEIGFDCAPHDLHEVKQIGRDDQRCVHLEEIQSDYTVIEKKTLKGEEVLSTAMRRTIVSATAIAILEVGHVVCDDGGGCSGGGETWLKSVSGQAEKGQRLSRVKVSAQAS
jgi:hypothetical protein